MLVRVLARAKINLTLKVIGRGADGYHRIVSLVSMLDLSDELRFEREPDRSKNPAPIIRARSRPELEGKENLIYKAIELFREQSAIRGRIEVDLIKRIPIAAGLGGGSADAAATLLALNLIAGENRLDHGRLRELAVKLGADVALFLRSSPSIIEGIGENVRPVRVGGEPLRLILIKPNFGLRAKDVYQNFDPRTIEPFDPDSIEKTLSAASGSPDRIASLISNDLVAPAKKLAPTGSLDKLEERLAHSNPAPIKVGMSGSGPTFFGLYQTSSDRDRAFASIERGLDDFAIYKADTFTGKIVAERFS